MVGMKLMLVAASVFALASGCSREAQPPTSAPTTSTTVAAKVQESEAAKSEAVRAQGNAIADRYLAAAKKWSDLEGKRFDYALKMRQIRASSDPAGARDYGEAEADKMYKEQMDDAKRGLGRAQDDLKEFDKAHPGSGRKSAWVPEGSVPDSYRPSF